ncbi:MAG: phospholipase D-like domain-containing protein [Phormidesmis sp.]
MIFQRIRHQRRFLLVALGLSLVAGSSVWRITTASTPAVQPLIAPLPQDPYLQVFFNHSEASVYSEPYRQIDRLGDDLEQAVITAIEQATTSVDIAVQALNLPLVAQALVDSHRRGVSVRLVLENQYAHPATHPVPTLTPAEDAHREPGNALDLLWRAQVPLLDDTADGSKGSGLMHHKFLVIDGRWVLTGSANLTFSGIHGDAENPESRGNANVLLKIDSPAIAAYFTQEFDLMWGDGPAARPDSRFGLQKPSRPTQAVSLPTGSITLQFSPHSASKPWPQSVNGLISQTLAQSTRSIDLALFVFSEQRIANQLENRVKAGAALRALIDPGFAYRSYSEALDMLGMSLRDQRCRIEPDNRPWLNPIDSVGSPRLPVGDKLHHKFAVIDRATVIVGSQNWSHAANTENDEALLVIRNPTVAAHFSREFERLYRNPMVGKTLLLERKAEESRQRCP